MITCANGLTSVSNAPAFTSNGISTDAEIAEHVKSDAKILGLAGPVALAKIFHFEVNQELGGK